MSTTLPRRVPGDEVADERDPGGAGTADDENFHTGGGKLEAGVGIEPTLRVLQTPALPLGYPVMRTLWESNPARSA